MRVTFGSYGKTRRTRTIRGAAPCGSWFAHSPAKHFAGGRPPGRGARGVRVGPGPGREARSASELEDFRLPFLKNKHRYMAEAPRLPLTWRAIRSLSL